MRVNLHIDELWEAELAARAIDIVMKQRERHPHHIALQRRRSFKATVSHGLPTERIFSVHLGIASVTARKVSNKRRVE